LPKSQSKDDFRFKLLKNLKMNVNIVNQGRCVKIRTIRVNNADTFNFEKLS